MLVAIIEQQSGFGYLFAGMVALLVIAVLIAILTTEEPPSDEGEPSPAFSHPYLARVPDHVRRMQAVRGPRRLLTLELLAVCTWECCAKIRESIRKIRR